MVETITWHDGAVRLIDQTRLPGELVLLDCHSVEQLAVAIETLQVRGAPAIGVSAAYGLALAAALSPATALADLVGDLRLAQTRLARTRPTAINLFWALRRQMALVETYQGSAAGLRAALLAEAKAIAAEDVAMCEAIGRFGADLLPDGVRLLTHCNAGALATVRHGTALAVVREAHARGKLTMVYADETRPLLQGARLTAWELTQDRIPVTLITDNMAAYAMRLGRIDAAVVGADRIAANGDVANKIGTYGVALACRAHGLPFYVAAPYSTFDTNLADGSAIPIEQRAADEVRQVGGVPIAPRTVEVFNPAFDVTPAELVTAIITDRGVLHPPYAPAIAALLND